MVRRTKELGMNAMAITDHGTLAGWLMVQEACKKYNIKPIFGVEAYFVDDVNTIRNVSNQLEELKNKLKTEKKELAKQPEVLKNLNDEIEQVSEFKKTLRKYNHLILLAKNWNGCLSLIRIHNRAVIDGTYFKPRCDFRILEEEISKGDVIASSACLGGRIAKCIQYGEPDEAVKNIHRFNNIFGKGNFYLELQLNHEGLQKNLNIELVKLSEATGTPLSISNDSHYINEGDQETRALLRKLDTEGDSAYNDTAMVDLYIRNEDQLFLAWKKYMDGLPAKYLAEAIKNTRIIADSVEIFSFDTSLKFPNFDTGNDSTQEEFLKQNAIQGMFKKNIHNKPIYIDRLKRELKTINKLGFASYFNVISDLTANARLEQSVGVGRGSGSGSLVGYCLGITNVDPVRHELYFERFLDESKGLMMPTFGLEIADIALDQKAILEACACHKTK